MSASSSRMWRSPLRTTPWSSHKATRIASANGHLQPYRRASSRAGVDGQGATDQRGALAHHRQPERASEGHVGVEALAVVFDHGPKPAGVAGDHTARRCRHGAGYDVGEGLFHYAVTTRINRARVEEGKG